MDWICSLFSSSNEKHCDEKEIKKLTPDQELDGFLRKIFNEMDTSHDGKLSVRECAAALEKAHLPNDLESVRRMRNAIRKEMNNDGAANESGKDIEFGEFCAFYRHRYATLSKRFEELLNLQQLIMNSKNNIISNENGDACDPKKVMKAESNKKRIIMMSVLKDIVRQYLIDSTTFPTTVSEFNDNNDETNISATSLNDWINQQASIVPDLIQFDEETNNSSEDDLWKNPGLSWLNSKWRKRKVIRNDKKTNRVAALNSATPTVQNELIAKIFDRLDLDGDGEVNFEEFAKTLILVPQFQLDTFLDRVLDNTQFYQDATDTLPARPVFSERSSNPYYLGFKKAVCVFAASAVARIVTAPADRLRILMMVSDEKHMSIKTAVSIIRKDGRVRGWFLGNGSNTIKLASELTVKLNTFDSIYSKITGDDPRNANFLTRMFAGGVAGLAATVASQPSEVVRLTIAASPRGTYKGFHRTAWTLYKNEGGIRRFYWGFVPTALSIVPFSAIDLSINSVLKDWARNYMKERNQVNNYPLLFGCCMCSSIVATVSTFPLYVLRTRIAVSGDKLIPSIEELHRVAGWRGFYRGMIPALAKIVPASTVGYTVYDWFDRRL